MSISIEIGIPCTSSLVVYGFVFFLEVYTHPLPNYLGQQHPQASVLFCGGAAAWFSCRPSSSDLSSDMYGTLNSCV